MMVGLGLLGVGEVVYLSLLVVEFLMVVDFEFGGGNETGYCDSVSGLV